MGSGNNQDNLTAAYIDDTAVIRIEGRGSFKISPPMKQFIHQVINKRSAQRILLDMSDCVGMDSTFMGVLAGVSCYIKNQPAITFKLINLSKKIKNCSSHLASTESLTIPSPPLEKNNNWSVRPTTGSKRWNPTFQTNLKRQKPAWKPIPHL